MMHPLAHLMRSGVGPPRPLPQPRAVTAVVVRRIHGHVPPGEYAAVADRNQRVGSPAIDVRTRTLPPAGAGPLPARLLCDEAGQLYAWGEGSLTPIDPVQLGQTSSVTPEPGFRPLLPEPGRGLVVRWGAFRPLLFSQMARPERLREHHRVAVNVQVYEVTRPQRLDELAESVLGDRSRGGELAVLTDALAAQLGLMVGPPCRIPAHLEWRRPAPDVLAAGERVLRLTLAGDPTVEPACLPATEAPREASATGKQLARRTSIPEAFARPWEFRRSREEVLYEMASARTLAGRVRAALRGIAGGFGGGPDFQRWQLLLAGKSPDEQLWTVRPPRRAFGDRFVREWVQQTLDRAGYDAQTMPLEWEIFWRRKSE